MLNLEKKVSGKFRYIGKNTTRIIIGFCSVELCYMAIVSI